MSDAELDSYSVKFEAGNNRYVSFNEADMTLEIDQFIPLGVYQINLSLLDDDPFKPEQTDYEVTILII